MIFIDEFNEKQIKYKRLSNMITPYMMFNNINF
nr:MAG TPA: hypothetical protein [Caudoviricetes sp.]